MKSAASLLLLGSLALASSGWAQTAPPATPTLVTSLAQLSVQIWPEYDKPAALVMMDVQLPPKTPLPALVPIKIPAAAGKPHAVAQRGTDNKLYLANYKTDVKGEWATISVVTDRQVVHLEYYLAIDRKKPERKFEVAWPEAPQIGNVVYGVQSPAAATKLATVPAATKLSRDGRGLTMHMIQVGAHAAGKPLTLEISYTNEKGMLTAEALSKNAPAAVPQSTPPAAAGSARTARAPAMRVSTEPEKKKEKSNTLLIVVIVAAAAFGMGFAVATQRKGDGDKRS